MRFSHVGLVALAFSTLFSCVSSAQTEAAAPAAETAKILAESSGFPGGVCVVVGCADADMAIAISEQGPFVVHALCDDPAALDRVRRNIRSRGLYGKVSADIAPPGRLPYTENLVNIVVADRWPAIASKDLSVDEVLRVLAPRGVAFLGDSGASPDAAPPWLAKLRRELKAAGIEDVQVVGTGGLWLKVTKPRPDNIDEWTHSLHAADGNPVANDTVVGPPRHYQWIADPIWSRAHDTDSNISAVVTSRGRIYYIVDEAPISLPGDHPLPDKWFLAARDAFNGVLLWKVPIKHWGWREWKHSWFLARPGDIPLNLEMRLVAPDDNVYVTLGYRAPVSRLDGRTGKTLQTYEGTEGTREILYLDGTLILTMPAAKGALPAKVVALDAKTGRRLWQTGKGYQGTTTDYIRWKESRGGVKPAVLDPALNPATDGKTISLIDGQDIVGLDFKTGREKWRTTIPNEPEKLWMGAQLIRDGVVVYASPTQLVGLSATTGKILWTQPKAQLGHLWYEWKDVFVIDGLVWTWSAKLEQGTFRNRVRWPASVNGYDLHTGELKKEVPLGGIFKTHHHHRCYRNKATVRYILASRRGTEFVDLENGHHTVDNWVRGACHYGMLPANGFLYAPPHPCRCYILEKLNGFNALAPQREIRNPKSEIRNVDNRLENGPAYGKIRDSNFEIRDSSDWRTFRHDPMRSGATPVKLPKKLDLRWNVKLGEKVSAPIVVGDRVYVALVDEHHVAAISTKDGKRVWEFCAGGRVDSPPTYHRGTLLFGSADGRVYCVRASDGQLVWRFDAAPEDRRIGAFGQLESAWPVHGSILVLDGKAYFAAGRSSHLDGGIRLFALDATSGKVIHQANVEGPRYTVENITNNHQLPEGALADILLGDDESIYMRGYRFDHKLAKKDDGGDALTARGGFLEDTYFQRAYWHVGNQGNFARLIATDAESIYMVRMFDRIRALDPKHFFTPGDKGYTLLAQSRGNLRPQWSTQVPVRIRAMVVAGDKLVTAGPPDVVDPKDPLGAFEGRKGGVLGTFDARSGEKLSEQKLDSPPVFNGAAVAGGRLYIISEDGSLSCFGSR